MPVEIRVPPLGESLVDAVVGQWLKSEGDSVSRGETIVELETDKVNLDVTAPEDGVLGKIEHGEGDVVTVGDLLGTVAEGAASASANGAGSAGNRRRNCRPGCSCNRRLPPLRLPHPPQRQKRNR